MRVSDFDYSLPRELIAQEPVEPRDASRLLVLHRDSGVMEHRNFRDILRYLRKGDCLVLNDTKVIRARLMGRKPTGGLVEVFLLRDTGDDVWEARVRPGKRLGLGTRVVFGDGDLQAEVVDRTEFGGRLVKLFTPGGRVREAIERVGTVPLPPYIHRPVHDAGRYQTVYAREDGSVAAPTAGLHFTPSLLEDVEGMGVRVAYVTLHVGLGTFRPVQVDEVEEHRMHAEHYSVPAPAAALINGTVAQGGRVIAVGTTVVRTLESVAPGEGRVNARDGWTSAFIYPGYEFKVVSALVTNFHLPKSTLLMLVSAFAGTQSVLHAYAEAVRRRYRFYSFGDAMLVI
ncbi:MAG: tRNA preQ1(34) S-adenosylmethionine ribosyltransferase-isomerase QueA [Firmicutes bacterium]|nr:tRNA preQ1(34) S-adenosylmethionine ribosyltransferase-isomerase QueA [Bacillota bacterium]